MSAQQPEQNPGVSQEGQLCQVGADTPGAGGEPCGVVGNEWLASPGRGRGIGVGGQT